MRRIKNSCYRSSQAVFIAFLLLALLVFIGNLTAGGRPEAKAGEAATEEAAAEEAAAEEAAAEKEEIVYVFVANNDPKILDPLFTTAYNAQRHGFRVYDTLFDEDENGKPIPQMVDTWNVSSDGMVYTFNLRPGQLFHDGAPVTANDCVASLKRWMQSDNKGKVMAESVKDVVAKDSDTFEIVLSKQYGMVIESLASSSGMATFIMPERIAKTPGDKQIDEYIGSGPFILEAIYPGDRLEYVKNEKYVPRSEPPSGMGGGKVVYIDRLIVRYIGDMTSRLAALQNGDVDQMSEVPPDMVPALEKAPGVTLGSLKTGQQLLMRVNILHPPFSNIKARQALQYLIDQEAFAKVWMVPDERHWDVNYCMYTSMSPWQTDAGSERLKEHNPEKAKQLFMEAGYAGETIQVIDVPDFSALHKVSIYIVDQLRSIGLNAELKTVSGGQYYETRLITKSPSEGGWSIFFSSVNKPQLTNPIFHLALFAGSTPDNLAGWPGWPMNPKIMELMKEFPVAANAAERQKIADQIHAESMEYVSYIPLGESNQFDAWRSKWTGHMPAGFWVHWNIRPVE